MLSQPDGQIPVCTQMQQDPVLTSSRKALAVVSSWVRAGTPSKVVTPKARASVLILKARLGEAPGIC